jgi:mannose-1-phosphate guanylyltransferase
MAGGIGSRFWPVSRTNYPKQFLDILGTGQTLIQQTFKRLEKIVPKENIYVVTSRDYADLVASQLPGIPKKNILDEPERKNTAPCIAYVSFRLFKEDPEAIVVIAPADHLISDDEQFAQICQRGLNFVQHTDALVTLGIKPTHANTGYGYIRYDKKDLGNLIFKVTDFKEKPSLPLAMEYIASGDYLWNSGIFIWKISDIIKAFETFLPEVYNLFNNELAALNTLFEANVLKNIYESFSEISIDFAIMEKADNVYIIPAFFAWSDLGAWNSVWENMNKDENKNAVAGKNVMVLDSSNCVVHAPDDKLVVLQGLNDYIIIDTSDVLLICEKNKEQYIKEYIQQVKNKKGERYLYTPGFL